MADIVKNVAKVAAPVVGGMLGGPGGAAAGMALSGLLSGGDQNRAIGNAANQSTAATNYATELQRYMYDTNRAMNEPWRAGGTDAIMNLRHYLMASGLDSSLLDAYETQPFDFQTDPGYQFRMDEGRKGLERSAAARGGYLSGNALKGLDRYNQDYASNEYNNAFRRWSGEQTDRFNRHNTTQSNQFSKLASLAGLGQAANNQVASSGANYATNAGNLAMNNAYTQGNAGIAQSNVNNSMYSGIGNALAYGAGRGGGGNMLTSMYSGLGGMGSGIGAGLASIGQGWSPFDYSGYNAVADYIDPF